MSSFTLNKCPDKTKCQQCRIESKDVFRLKTEAEPEKILCSICLSIHHPDKFKKEMRVGLMVKRKSNRRLFSLLFRALAHAETSGNEHDREKAERIKAALLSTTEVVLNETGSDDAYDLQHLIRQHHQLLPMNFESDFIRSVSASDDGLPDTARWKEIYNAKRGN